MAQTPQLPIAAKELIPHREKMALLKELTDFSDNYAHSIQTVMQEDLFVNRGNELDSIVFVELLAQLASAYSGYDALINSGKLKNGFLVGIQNFSIMQDVRVGDVLSLVIDKKTEIDKISFFDAAIKSDDLSLASGTIKVWESEGEMPTDSQCRSVIPEKNIGDIASLIEKFSQISNLNREILNNLYSFNRSSESCQITGDFFFDESFIGFQGHFPGFSIFPGVLLLKIGALVSELALNKRLMITKIHNAKFIKLVFPNQSFQCRVNIEQDGDGFKCKATFFRNDEQVSIFSFSAEEK